MGEQTLGQHARQRRDIHLHEIRQIAVENALEGVPQHGVVPSNRKNAKPAE